MAIWPAWSVARRPTAAHYGISQWAPPGAFGEQHVHLGVRVLVQEGRGGLWPTGQWLGGRRGPTGDRPPGGPTHTQRAAC